MVISFSMKKMFIDYPGDASNMRVELVERARFDGVMTGVMRARARQVRSRIVGR